MNDKTKEPSCNERATFVVSVKFTRNATWQGSITWTEKKKTVTFRSALEMLKLMDSAVGKDPEADAGQDWN